MRWTLKLMTKMTYERRKENNLSGSSPLLFCFSVPEVVNTALIHSSSRDWPEGHFLPPQTAIKCSNQQVVKQEEKKRIVLPLKRRAIKHPTFFLIFPSSNRGNKCFFFFLFLKRLHIADLPDEKPQQPFLTE